MTIIDLELFGKLREVLTHPDSQFYANPLLSMSGEVKMVVSADSYLPLGIELTDRLGVSILTQEYLESLSKVPGNSPLVVRELVRGWSVNESLIGVSVRLVLSRIKSPSIVGTSPVNSVWLVDEVLTDTSTGVTSSTLSKLSNDLHNSLVLLDGVELKRATQLNEDQLVESTLESICRVLDGGQ